MKKLIHGSLTLTALLVSSLSLASSDLPWSGLFVGANIGDGWGGESINHSGSTTNAPLSVAAAVNLRAIPPSLAGNPSGAIGGLEANYNYEFDNRVVLGAAADYDWSNIFSSQTANTNIAPFPRFMKNSQQTLESLGTVRALLGYNPVNYAILAYLTGGFGYGNVTMKGSIASPGCVSYCGSGTSSGMNSGWTVGAGLGYRYTNWGLKLEYLYYSLGTQNMTITDPAFPGSLIRHTVDYKGNVVRFGANYKFM